MNITELLDIAILQHIQNSFCDYMGMPTILTDVRGIPLIDRDGSNEDFCFKLTRASTRGDTLCRECDKKGMASALETGKPVVYVCHAGLVDFAIPIMLNGKPIGGIVGGQIRPNEINENHLRTLATNLGINPDEYIEAAKRTKCFAFSEIESMVQFISEMVNNIVLIAYNKSCEIETIRKMERSAHAHSNLLLNVGHEIFEKFHSWLNSIENLSTAVKNDSNLSKELNEITTSGNKILSLVASTLATNQITNSNIDFSEKLYNPRDVIMENIMPLKEKAKERNVEILVTFDENLPEQLLGNSENIGLIINKTVEDCIFASLGNQTVEISTSCEENLYSNNLIIKIKYTETNMDRKLVEDIIEYIEHEDSSDITEKLKTLDIPFLFTLLKKIHGQVSIKKIDEEVFRIIFTFPQLIPHNI